MNNSLSASHWTQIAMGAAEVHALSFTPLDLRSTCPKLLERKATPSSPSILPHPSMYIYYITTLPDCCNHHVWPRPGSRQDAVSELERDAGRRRKRHRKLWSGAERTMEVLRHAVKNRLCRKHSRAAIVKQCGKQLGF